MFFFILLNYMKTIFYLIEKFIKIQRIHCINAKKRVCSEIYRVYDFDLTKYPRDHKIISDCELMQLLFFLFIRH